MAYQTNFNQPTAIVAVFVAVVATSLATYAYNKFRRYKSPSEWRAVGKVRKLCIYPVKSGRRLEVDRAECMKQGLMEAEKFDKSLRLRDRTFVVYHEEKYEQINSGHYPKIVLVEIKAEHMNHVLLNAPNMISLLLRVPDKTTDKEVVLKNNKNERSSMDCGNEAAIWISQYLLGKDSGFRIAFYDSTVKKNSTTKHGFNNESKAFDANTGSMHIVNQTSIGDINRRMGNSNITADYFRPNLVVDGLNLKPFEESNWKWIKIGDIIMKNVAECMRCKTTTINPETGDRREDKEPLTTLRTVTKGPEKAPLMGILLEIFHSGTISVGDTVYVSTR